MTNEFQRGRLAIVRARARRRALAHGSESHGTSHGSGSRATESRATGFTLLELLIVLAIILVIITLLVVAVRGVVTAGTRTASLNALRQMGAAFVSYCNDHRQQIMPGYINPGLQGTLGYTAEFNSVQLQPPDTAYYTFRLLPYLDDQWKTLCVDYDSPQFVEQVSEELGTDVFGPASAGPNQLGIARVPSFGMNSIFVGGDSEHGGPAVDFSPWNTLNNEPIAATRMSQILNPSKLIVFGASHQGNTGLIPPPADVDAGQLASELELGYAELRAPFLAYDENANGGAGEWTDAQWLVGDRGRIVPAATAYDTSGPIGIGLPIGRSGVEDIPVAMADGSAAVEKSGPLSVDMTRWSPFHVGKQNVTVPTP